MNLAAIDKPGRVSGVRCAVVGAMLLLVACGGDRPVTETAVRDWIAEAIDEAEGRERRALMRRVSDGYADTRGNERSDIDNLLRLYFARLNRFELVTTIDAVRIFEGSAAEVDMTVGMAGTGIGVLGFSADAYTFSLDIQLEDDDWRLIAARWRPVGGT